jgi:hypothetical protein
MKPENTQSAIGPEQLPMPPASVGEQITELPTPETGLDTGLERVEQAAEASAAAADAAVIATPVVTNATPSTTPVVDDTSPIVAGDDDVIEKEWVDKAKKIILETKDDPHSRSSRVNDLQKDYLKKRYGKVLGASE